MDIQKQDLNRELGRVKEKIDKATALDEEDLKIILLSMFNEEDLHEGKQ